MPTRSSPLSSYPRSTIFFSFSPSEASVQHETNFYLLLTNYNVLKIIAVYSTLILFFTYLLLLQEYVLNKILDKLMYFLYIFIFHNFFIILGE